MASEVAVLRGEVKEYQLQVQLLLPSHFLRGIHTADALSLLAARDSAIRTRIRPVQYRATESQDGTRGDYSPQRSYNIRAQARLRLYTSSSYILQVFPLQRTTHFSTSAHREMVKRKPPSISSRLSTSTAPDRCHSARWYPPTSTSFCRQRHSSRPLDLRR